MRRKWLLGATTRRTTYRLAGQIVAVRVQGSTPSYTYFDHLGSISVLSSYTGAYTADSLALYEPYGAFRAAAPATNPTVTNHGFTGHRHNNTGSNNLALIYMNARYYLPEIGRFATPDTSNFNRYSYR